MDWKAIRLVVFDVDGTLYNQRPLRIRITLELLADAAMKWNLGALRILSVYRKLREKLGDDETPSFELELVIETAQRTGRSEDYVRRTVADWMETRPLRHLPACRYPGVERLFAGLRRKDKTIAILSDYPVAAKLAALGLEADFEVCASDPDVGVLKPNPLGLLKAMAVSGARPDETVLIGDRIDRDGEAARRCGAAALIRSSTPKAGWATFVKYDDPIFEIFLEH
jgi:putative hydrolase of the HAD superfamily